MRKIILSFVSLLVTVAFVPGASALPVFARQTGMACSACHFQHFPELNAFGRAFKASGFTMMGAQGKVEDEHLSIPDRLNLGVLATFGVEKQSGNPTGAEIHVPANGGELSIFYGGHVTDNIGFLSELGLVGAAGTGAAKLPILFDVGNNTRVGAVPYTTDGKGPGYAFELLNTGAVSVHEIVPIEGINGQHSQVFSANQYLTAGMPATGVNFVAVNPNMGFLSAGVFSIQGPGGVTSAGSSNTNTNTAGMGANRYVRAAAMFNAGGWDSAVGIQNYSGGNGVDGVACAIPVCNTIATIIDGQMQGEVNSMPLGVYASYGRAPKDATGTPGAGSNLFNPNNVNDKKSFNLAAELGVIPHKATVMAAYRSGKNGAASGVDSDNAFMLGATYELYQNAELAFVQTWQTGSAWNDPAPVGKNANSIKFVTLF